MNALPYQPEIAQRMTRGTDESIATTAEFYQTENGYWLAWLGDGCAFVLPPDLADDEPADRVEGADDLVELLAMIESGEYAAMLEFEGTDEEWESLTACACGDEHHHHH